jgi:DNA polymerase-3 subunit delta
MKIAAKQIAGFLAKPSESAHAALFYGPDAGLARERMAQTATKILGPNADPFAKLEMSESALIADPAKLADELASVGFLSPQKVIVIRDGSDKLTKILEAAEEFMRADSYIIVVADELGPRSSLRGWFEKGAKVAAVPCYQDEERDVQEVVRAAFSAAGINVGFDVLQYITSQLGNDRYVTRQEIEKMVLFAGEEKSITLQDAMDLVGYNREADMDDFINALADKNVASLDKELKELLKAQTQPVQYLRSLSRYFHRLYVIKLQAEHSSIESVIATLRPPVFFKQVPILTRHAKNWNLEAIAKAIRIITSAELACKTTDMPAVAASSRKLMQITQIR